VIFGGQVTAGDGIKVGRSTITSKKNQKRITSKKKTMPAQRSLVDSTISSLVFG
jgi:hypothetical protein